MKNNFFITFLSALVVMAFMSQASIAQEKSCSSDTSVQNKTELIQTNCPVMGGKIDKKMHYDYKGKRVYFCCSSCITAFQKEPEKYMQKMMKDGVNLENAPIMQKNCPVSGKPINKEIFSDYQGKRVYFCCSVCREKFIKSPEKYLKKM